MSTAQRARAARNSCPACRRQGTLVAYPTGSWRRYRGHGTPPPAQPNAGAGGQPKRTRMPDRFGFNQLPPLAPEGETVRCIYCPTGGPIWHWPEDQRRQHARKHRRAPERSAAHSQRQRILLAAALADPNEEKEAITMTNKTIKQGEPAKQVAIDLLGAAGEPLHAKEIAKRVIATGRCAGLKGKTPEQTITAMLAVGSKPGGPFKRVSKGTYTLAEQPTEQTPQPVTESSAPEAANDEQPPNTEAEAKQAPKKRQSATAAKAPASPSKS